MDSALNWLVGALTSGRHSELLLRALDVSGKAAIPAMVSTIPIAHPLTDEPEQPHADFVQAMYEPFVYAWDVVRKAVSTVHSPSDDAGRTLHG